MRSIAEYQRLIQRLERFAAESPRRYLCQVAALAILGIAFVVVGLVGALATVVGMAAVMLVSKKLALAKVAWIPLAFAYLIVKAMWMRIPPPEGRLLARREAPKLFAEIDAVRKRLGAPKIHRVIATAEFNAAIAQVPRFGLFWPENHLVVGLPLMAGLTVDEFRAVLAHEFGHLSRHHARFSSWIYRIRQTWHRLPVMLGEDTTFATRLFARFFSWYTPYFNAYSFVLARANEYEADRASARIAGAAAAGSALVTVHAKAAYLDSQYWQKLWTGVRDRPEPPVAVYSELLRRCKAVPVDLGRAYAKVVLGAKSDLNDTHPSLADRLRALGVPPRAQFEIERSAADALLGDVLSRLASEQDRAWQEQVAPAWRERHVKVAEQRQRFAELEQRAASGALTLEMAWERARLAEAIDGRYAALPLYRQIVERHPHYAAALYAYGRLLVQSGDEQGVPLVEQAIGIDDDAAQAGAELLFDFYRGRKDVARMDHWHARLNALAERREAARAELTQFSARDALLPHGLTPAMVSRFVSAIAMHRQVKRAWVVRKHGRQMPKVPGHLVLIEFRWSIDSLLAGDRTAAIRSLLDDLTGDEDGFIVVRDARRFQHLRRKVETVPRALVFSRL